MNTGSFELNLKDQSVLCSDGFLQLLNLTSSSEVSSWTEVLQFIHEDCINHFLFLFQRLKENQTNFSEVLSWVRECGDIISLNTIGEYVSDSEGDKAFFVVQRDQSFDDDTRKNLLLQSVIERAKDGVLITEAEPSGPDGRKVVYVNPAFTDVTGYKPEEIVGKTPKILQGERTDSTAIRKMRKALKEWKPCEVSLINYRKNGEEFWMNLSMTPVADENGWFTHWVAIERDATQSVHMELKNQLLSEISLIFSQSSSFKEAMQQAAEKVLDFGDFSTSEFWVPNEETKKLYLVSYTYKDEVGKLFYENSSSIDEFAFGEGLPGLVWENLEPVFMEDVSECLSFLRKDAAQISGLQYAYGIPLLIGEEFQGVLLLTSQFKNQAVLDRVELLNQVNEELASEIQRKNTEDDYNQLFKNAPDLICICGFDGVFRRINSAGEEILGYSSRELLSRPFIDFVHPDDKSATELELLKLTIRRTSIKFENRYITPNNKVKWLSWSATSFPEQRVIHAVGKDITEQKKLEELLQEASSMASVGSWEYNLIDDAVYWSPISRKIHGEPAGFQPISEQLINYFKKEDQEFVLDKMQKCIELGESFDFEVPIITRRGEEVWIRIIGKAEIINGECVSIYGSLQDINQRKQSELRLKHIADNLPGVIFQYELSPDGSDRMNYVSKGSHEIFGLSPEECIEDTRKIWDQVAAGGSVEDLKKSIKESTLTMSQWNATARIKKPNGELVWLEGLGIPRKRQNGSIVWDSIVLNVSEKIALSDSLRRAGRMSMVGSWEAKVSDRQASEVYLSSITHEIFEIDETLDLRLMDFIEFFKGENKDLIECSIQQLLAGGAPFDSVFLITTKKGSDKWVRCMAECELDSAGVGRVYGSIQDVHKAKTTEIELQKTLEEKNMLLESIGDGFFSVNQEWEVTYWNSQAEMILQRERKSIVGKKLWDSIPEAELSNFQDMLYQAMNSEDAVYFEDYLTGMLLWIEVSAYPSKNGLSVFLKDISGRKKAEEEIKLSNERFVKVTEATHDAIWDWDILNDLIYRSVGFQKLFGYKHDAPVRNLNSWMKKIHPKDFPGVKQLLDAVLEDPNSLNFSAEYRFLKRDGKYAHVMDRGVIIRDDFGAPIRIVGSMSDITERNRRIKAIQAQNEKLKEIAWTQSHIVRAPLARLMGLVMEIQKNEMSEEESSELMKHILNSAEELDEIIRNIVVKSKIVLNLEKQ